MNFVVAESLMSSSILDVRYVWGAEGGRSDIVLMRSCILLDHEMGMYKLIPVEDQHIDFVRASSYTQKQFHSLPWEEIISIHHNTAGRNAIIQFTDDHNGALREAYMSRVCVMRHVCLLQRWARQMIPNVPVIASRKRWYTLCMSQHPRLGADSLLRHVDKEIVCKIHALC